MPILPSRITFTGIDANTDLGDALALQQAYPVEFGVLVSPTRTGNENRYPLWSFIDRLRERRLNLSMHICGSYAQRIMDGDSVWDLSLSYCSRVQINHRHPDPDVLVNFQTFRATPVIAQWRSLEPPTDHRIDWLFDQSGGRGLAPGAWPAHQGLMLGYAGGITPENVVTVLNAINAINQYYWIDMESGVRDIHDWFDLRKCFDVCQAVYGPPGEWLDQSTP